MTPSINKQLLIKNFYKNVYKDIRLIVERKDKIKKLRPKHFQYTKINEGSGIGKITFLIKGNTIVYGTSSQYITADISENCFFETDGTFTLEHTMSISENDDKS